MKNAANAGARRAVRKLARSAKQARVSFRHRWEVVPGSIFTTKRRTIGLWVRCIKCGDRTQRDQAKRGWNAYRPKEN